MKSLGSARGIWILAIALGLTGASCATQVTTDRRPLTVSEPDAATKATIQAAYGRLPLSFEANQGQTDPQVKFLSRGRGHTLFLTSTEAVLTLRQPASNLQSPRPRFGGEGQGEGAVLRMQLVGANSNPQVVGLDELPGKSNYFIGSDPSKWRTGIPHYAKVKYEGLYLGIDLVFYGNQRQLEYDFVVAPGADPKVIQLAFDGLPPHPVPLVAQPSWLRAGWKPAPPGEREPMPSVFAPSPFAGEGQDGGKSRSPLQIDTNGDLILHTAGGELRLHKPRIYQEINGIKQPIPGGYVLLELETQNSKLETQKVGFQVSAYDTSKPLIIDPVLSYSTYLGGSRDEYGNGIAVDSSSNAYVTGWTFSTNFPTASPFQATRGAGFFKLDAFVTKLNPTGNVLVYSTYLGGRRDDQGKDIAVDASGNAYVTGSTNSTDFPTVSPFQAAGDPNADAFVTKLNAAGSALVYSTYLGGSGLDNGGGIAVDSSGNVYVAGETASTNFPAVSPLCAGKEAPRSAQATS